MRLDRGKTRLDWERCKKKSSFNFTQSAASAGNAGIKEEECGSRKRKRAETYLATSVRLTGIFVSHDSVRGGEHQAAELTRGQQLVAPALNLREGDIKTRADHARLVEAAQKVNDDFARAVVIDDFEFADIAVLLHQAQELDDNARSGAEEDLALTTALGVGDGLEGVSEGINKDHFVLVNPMNHTVMTMQTYMLGKRASMAITFASKRLPIARELSCPCAPHRRHVSLLQQSFASTNGVLP